MLWYIWSFSPCLIMVGNFFFHRDFIYISGHFSIIKYSVTGFLAPVYGLAILVTDNLQDHHDRLFGCQVIQICQSILLSAYFFTFFFSSVFRMILIRFSDRGLVVSGRPILVLFNQLYWTVFGAFFCLGISLFTILPIFRGVLEQVRQWKCQ